jgi:hypothetical protein
MENLDAIETALDRHGIDCGFERTGSIEVATSDHQVDELRQTAETDGGVFLDVGAMRAEVNSPTYLAGRWDKDGAAMVQPAKLAWGWPRPASGSASASASARPPPAWPATRTA